MKVPGLDKLRKEIEEERAAQEATERIREAAFQFVDESHVAQARFLRDVARRKVLFTTRRSGKTYGIARWLIEGAATKTGPAASLYIALTRDSGKRNYWLPCVAPVLQSSGLTIAKHGRALRYGEVKTNESDLSLTFWNGHVIYLLGMDANQDERRKLLGGKNYRVAVDEAQDFVHVDLEKMIDGDLGPSLTDLKGEITLAGTPSDVQHGYFYELTKEQDGQQPTTFSAKGWSGHRWTAYDNPHIAEQWAQELADLIAANPLVEETPTFQQNRRGRWVIDPSNLVYAYMPERNDWDGALPQKVARDGWHYVLGVDLGWGATAFTLKCYHDNLRPLFMRRSWKGHWSENHLPFEKRRKLDITDTAKIIDQLTEEFELETTQIDGANRQAVEEMRARHGVNVTAAEKRDKFDFIRLMNDDFIQGYIKINVAECRDYVAELKKLVKDPRKLAVGKHEEQAGLSNHNCDAGLYGWRYCYQYLSQPLTERAKPGTVEHAQQEADEMEQAAEEQFQAMQPEPEAPAGLDSSGWEDGWEQWR